MGDFRKKGGNRFEGGFGGGFNRQSSGRPNFPAKSWGTPDRDHDRNRGPITMHRATCGKCGNPCEVPFRPISGKMIFCNECFQDKRESGDTGRDRRNDRFPQKRFDDHKSFAKRDFSGDAGKGSDYGMKAQMEALNVKMDRLIKAVESMTNTKPLVAKEKTDIAAEISPDTETEKPSKKFSKK